MQWILLSLLSATILGFYDLAKKASVRDNAVPAVLLLNVFTAALIYSPVILISRLRPEWLSDTRFFIPPITASNHGLLFLKSALVGSSWTLAFFALKHLPLSIATPIRATSPLWTAIVAVMAFGERPSTIQWIGIATIMVAFFAFSQVGSREGIRFSNNRWVIFMIAATLLGSISALYDKFLLRQMNFSPSTVQAWFSIYLVVVMLPLASYWFLRQRKQTPFFWRWTIPTIAISLLVADFLYFTAISHPAALISVISPVRRTSVIIPFVFGIIWLGEQNWRGKAMCIGLMLVGVVLVSR